MTAKIDAIIKRAYAYLDQFYGAENEKGPTPSIKHPSSQNIETPEEELVLPENILPISIPKQTTLPKAPPKRFIYLKGKSGREIIDIIQKECGVHITINIKSKDRIVKKAKEILKEHKLGVVL